MSSESDAVAAAIRKLSEAQGRLGRVVEAGARGDSAQADLQHAHDAVEQTADQLEYVYSQLEMLPRETEDQPRLSNPDAVPGREAFERLYSDARRFCLEWELEPREEGLVASNSVANAAKNVAGAVAGLPEWLGRVVFE